MSQVFLSVSFLSAFVSYLFVLCSYDIQQSRQAARCHSQLWLAETNGKHTTAISKFSWESKSISSERTSDCSRFVAPGFLVTSTSKAPSWAWAENGNGEWWNGSFGFNQLSRFGRSEELHRWQPPFPGPAPMVKGSCAESWSSCYQFLRFGARQRGRGSLLFLLIPREWKQNKSWSFF